jgi:valyl-tRNA synthetase
MDKRYDPRNIENKWYQTWQRNGYFAPAGEGAAYCIMIPPPNITGNLHMGHAFQDTIMDALIRYHRMRGERALWQAGSDHAGIATQMVVERQINAEGKNRHDLGRERFIQRVWQWKEESGGTITRQLRRLGASLDWSRERFTMDEGLSSAVREVFVRLFEEGLIYRGQRLVNWDPVLHTAVSDLEVLSQEENGQLWYMRYPLVDDDGHVVVATTRPETMLGDAAVAVHPQDNRYGHLVGQRVKLPLTGRQIPILADEHVDPAFGTGCVKITPAHDFSDYAVWQRHRDALARAEVPREGLINIFTVDAKIVSGDEPEERAVAELIPPAYRRLERYAARRQIVADLAAHGLLERIEAHQLMVPRGDRSGAVIEPFLTDQWYVKVAPLAGPAIRTVEEGSIRFVPESWKSTYFDWMRNIQDWCISRQIWWGHRIPAWYDDQGRVFVGRSEEEIRTRHSLGPELRLVQDEDVLDTWFSSALWPFSTLGWPEQTEELQRFYPTSVLVTGFDIIFFWVARMIMMGLKFARDVPFREVYIHGLVRDAHGQKMSKSKGNILDPLDLIDGIDLGSLAAKRTQGLMQPEMADHIERTTREDFPNGIPAYGTDALRFTFAALATTGRDINFDLGRVEGYRNFCNKLWNAARYVLMSTEGKDTGADGGAVELTLAERWILARLQAVIDQVTRAIDAYRFDLVAQAIYDFTWSEYCDWYLEFSKPVLQNGAFNEHAQRGTRRTLVQVLESLLRLAHPIMPFISEEIWERIAPRAGGGGETIMLQPYPQPDPACVDEEAGEEMEWVQQFILAVRRIRGEMDIDPKRELPVLLEGDAEKDHKRTQEHRVFLTTLGRLQEITWLAPGQLAPESSTALVGEMKILIPWVDLIDKEAEAARLAREIEKLGRALERSETKLGNPKFLERAPMTVVEKERSRSTELRSAIAKLSSQANRIATL